MLAIKLPKENKDQIITQIKIFFEEERGEPIGDLAADLLLDFMIKEIGPSIYNQAIADARTLLNQKLSQVEEEMDALEIPIRK